MPNKFYIMLIRVFPSNDDRYNSIVIDTEQLPLSTSFGHIDDYLPTIFISELITDLIAEN